MPAYRIKSETHGMEAIAERLKRLRQIKGITIEVGTEATSPVNQKRKGRPDKARVGWENIRILRTERKRGRYMIELTDGEKEEIMRRIDAACKAWDVTQESLVARCKELCKWWRSLFDKHVAAGMSPPKRRWIGLKRALYGRDLPSGVASGQLLASLFVRVKE